MPTTSKLCLLALLLGVSSASTYGAELGRANVQGHGSVYANQNDGLGVSTQTAIGISLAVGNSSRDAPPMALARNVNYGFSEAQRGPTDTLSEGGAKSSALVGTPVIFAADAESFQQTKAMSQDFEPGELAEANGFGSFHGSAFSPNPAAFLFSQGAQATDSRAVKDFDLEDGFIGALSETVARQRAAGGFYPGLLRSTSDILQMLEDNTDQSGIIFTQDLFDQYTPFSPIGRKLLDHSSSTTPTFVKVSNYGSGGADAASTFGLSVGSAATASTAGYAPFANFSDPGAFPGAVQGSLSDSFTLARVEEEPLTFARASAGADSVAMTMKLGGTKQTSATTGGNSEFSNLRLLYPPPLVSGHGNAHGRYTAGSVDDVAGASGFELSSTQAYDGSSVGSPVSGGISNSLAGAAGAGSKGLADQNAAPGNALDLLQEQQTDAFVQALEIADGNAALAFDFAFNG